MNEPLISIIIPVYNVEKYLSRCLNSVISQDYKNIEIILVNDGSTDNSLKICNNYCQKYSFIKTLSKKNEGLSSARNYGIKQAEGSFLMFVDSDDYVSQTFCSAALNSQKKYNSDIVIFDYNRVTTKSQTHFFNHKQGIVNKKDAMQYLVSNSYAWNKLYRRKLFTNVEYPIGKYYEDEFTTYKLFEKSKIISYVKNPSYNYVETGESIVSKKNSRIIADQFESVYTFFDFLKKYYSSVYSKNLNALIIKALRYCTFCSPSYNHLLFEKAKNVLLENSISNDLAFKYKFTMLMFKLSPTLALQIFKLQKFRKKEQVK